MATFNAPSQTPPSNAPMVAFEKRIVFPGQTVITSRFTGKQDVVGRGPGYWAGSCTWKIRNDDGRRELEQMFAYLQGFIHTLKITLPASRYAPARASTGPTTIASSRLDAATHSAVLTFNANAGRSISNGDHLTVGGRLYTVTQANPLDSRVIRALPMVLPPDNSQVELAAPFVLVRAESEEQGTIAHQGWRDSNVRFDWVEAI